MLLGLLAGSMQGQPPSPITVDADWGVSTGAGTRNSATRTLTVPAGNPGTVTFNVVTNTGTLTYSKNGGTQTAVTNGGTLSVATGDTLAFRLTGTTGNSCFLAINDDYAATGVGEWSANIS